MLRKTIYAVVAVLAVGSTTFAPLSASAGGRKESGIRANNSISHCTGGLEFPGHVCVIR
jgi:hypothetical protein